MFVTEITAMISKHFDNFYITNKNTFGNKSFNEKKNKKNSCFNNNIMNTQRKYYIQGDKINFLDYFAIKLIQFNKIN